MLRSDETREVIRIVLPDQKSIERTLIPFFVSRAVQLSRQTMVHFLSYARVHTENDKNRIITGCEMPSKKKNEKKNCKKHKKNVMK